MAQHDLKQKSKTLAQQYAERKARWDEDDDLKWFVATFEGPSAKFAHSRCTWTRHLATLLPKHAVVLSLIDLDVSPSRMVPVLSLADVIDRFKLPVWDRDPSYVVAEGDAVFAAYMEDKRSEAGSDAPPSMRLEETGHGGGGGRWTPFSGNEPWERVIERSGAPCTTNPLTHPNSGDR
jgi:hypothetical protein